MPHERFLQGGNHTNVMPCLQALARAYDRAVGLELQHMRERKHVFKKARPAGGSSREGKAGSSKKEQGQGSKHQKSKLSFAEEEEADEQ
jgi:hypothetical protein